MGQRLYQQALERARTQELRRIKEQQVRHPRLLSAEFAASGTAASRVTGNAPSKPHHTHSMGCCGLYEQLLGAVTFAAMHQRGQTQQQPVGS